MNSAVELLQNRLITIPHSVQPVTYGVQVVFPESEGSDYHFEASVDKHEEFLEVSAVLGERWKGLSPNCNYFWYRSFEVVGAPAKDTVIRDWINTALILLGHDTKIKQTKGLWCWTFTCYYLDSGRWSRLSGNSALRHSNFKVPIIQQRIQWYQAKALAAPAQ